MIRQDETGDRGDPVVSGHLVDVRLGGVGRIRGQRVAGIDQSEQPPRAVLDARWYGDRSRGAGNLERGGRAHLVDRYRQGASERIDGAQLEHVDRPPEQSGRQIGGDRTG